MIAFTESAILVVASVIMSSAVILHAFIQKQQFYPSVVFLTKSNGSMAIIYLQAIVFVLLLGKLIRKVFFGQLRTAEMEHLIERSWYAVTETCLAFTVFRDDLSPRFVALFTLLLFLKCFHWLSEDRVDYMERSPNISLLFHIRVVSLLSILGSLDMFSIYMAYKSTLNKGASVQLVFGFEYAILLAVILNISMKYVLHLLDHYNDNPWEDKAIYLLYIELIMGFIKIVLYLAFIGIMVKYHTFPLFAIRPMYLTTRGFRKALTDVIMSRRAIRNMNTLYPNASQEDIENSDNVCIICRENMLGNGSCKKLPCNHIFHITCLRSWFQRQQTCPTCRMDVLRTSTQDGRPNAGANVVPPPQQPANAGFAGFAGNLGPLFVPPVLMQHFQNLFQMPVLNGQNGQAANPGDQANRPQPGPVPAPGPAPGSQQFPPPPFPIPPHIFAQLNTPPMPMPSLPTEILLQPFTDAQLRLLEGNERKSIEARLKCLNDVKTLIDAASIRLQQYNNVALNTQSTSDACTQTEAQVVPEPSVEVSQPSTSSHPISDSAVPGPVGDDNLIRQRRLQRFLQGNVNNEENDEDGQAQAT